MSVLFCVVYPQHPGCLWSLLFVQQRIRKWIPVRQKKIQTAGKEWLQSYAKSCGKLKWRNKQDTVFNSAKPSDIFWDMAAAVFLHLRRLLLLCLKERNRTKPSQMLVCLCGSSCVCIVVCVHVCEHVHLVAHQVWSSWTYDNIAVACYRGRTWMYFLQSPPEAAGDQTPAQTNTNTHTHVWSAFEEALQSESGGVC